MIDHWIQNFPAPQKEAITAALESASLAKIRGAMRLLEELDPQLRGPSLKIEILGTCNLEPILPALSFALSCVPARPQLQLAPLDSIEAHIAQSPAESQEPPDARVVIWRVEEVLPEVLFPFSHGFPEEIFARIEQTIERVDRVVSLHQRRMRGVPLFLSTIALPLHFSNPVFAAQHSAGVCAAVARVNQKIYEVATGSGFVYVLDLARWAAAEGSPQADPMLDFLARQPFSAKGQVAFGLFLARSLRPLIVARRKVLAIDLDETLWGGVVGEDGIENLKLGHDFPGNVHLRLQRELLELRNRGILLVLLSKNNEADARQAFESLPEMLLKWDDFAVRKIDWNHKHENLREAAAELGLGLDSFVFLDDSDYEREQIRQLIPEVLILNDSGDPLQMLRALWQTDAFDALTVTTEDRQRHRDYAVRTAREFKGDRDDLGQFLRSLEIEATIEEVGDSNVERVVTMLGKTNQFNLTTRRHSRAQVQTILETPGSIALALRLRDKFGDQGIVAALLAIPGDGATLTIDSFLVSCRALGRGVEDALWSAMLERAKQHKVRRVAAVYVPTARNKIVEEVYDRLGLQRAAHNASSTEYMLEPIGTVKAPPWVLINQHPHAR